MCDALACKHDISRRESCLNLKVGVKVVHVEEIVPTLFQIGEKSFKVNRVESMKTYQRRYFSN